MLFHLSHAAITESLCCKTSVSNNNANPVSLRHLPRKQQVLLQLFNHRSFEPRSNSAHFVYILYISLPSFVNRFLPQHLHCRTLDFHKTIFCIVDMLFGLHQCRATFVRALGLQGAPVHCFLNLRSDVAEGIC